MLTLNEITIITTNISIELNIQLPIIIPPKNNSVLTQPNRELRIRFICELKDSWSSGVTFDFKYNGVTFEPLTKPINFRNSKFITHIEEAKILYAEILKRLNGSYVE